MKKYIVITLILVFALSGCEIIIQNEGAIYIDNRDKFLGNYRIEEFSDTYNEISEYSIYISKSLQDADVIYIDNFYGVNIDIFVIVSGNKMTIPLQEINNYEIEGEGWYEYDKLHFDYVVRDLTRYHVINDYCSAVAW
ncbi:MAG: hypothetical protein OEW67_08790 [Cyclobacteriaceae bacterium]|nr:hypothetical protein [Cyclobacteriaceae bacterium]